MSFTARPPVTAVLGPTNTGKTHLAVERLVAHSSGIMGFPLRLLAREVYDRVVAIKGGNSVALVTGEERIVPPQARYFLCTAESMPVLSGRPSRSDEGPGNIDAAFVALDEAQLGADPERGHIFTERLLHARGREETMILGSESLRPIVRALVPEAEIVDRPRFSTLSYAGAAKLARLPRRSAVVAFSAEQVYAIAETLRRFKGGAAIVMGALSPRTRNAQVAMFQAGEVDYLVATDAIGMGLNMDVGHVAFAGLTKFDGHRQRRLTVAEMAQIAGRAGRHQRDGSFGYIGSEAKPGFTQQEVFAIEEHRFPALDHLYWRDADPRFDSIPALIADLEAPPGRRELRAAPLATDLAVLKLLAAEQDVADTARDPAMVRRLWSLCGLPDFQKTGPWHHARTVHRLWRFIGHGRGTIDAGWYMTRLDRLDSIDGDVETVAARIAAVRSWTYIAHRADWLDEPAEMAGRASDIELRLSDALHAKLTQRFVDRRTSVLLRTVGRGAAALPVAVDAEGGVSVDGEAIGTLAGFRFSVDASVRASDRKLLLAAADRHLAGELRARAAALIQSGRQDMALAYRTGEAPQLTWRGHRVATLAKGRDLLHPEIRLDPSVQALDRAETSAIAERLRRFLDEEITRLLGPLAGADALAKSPEAPAELRAVLAALVDSGGILARERIEDALRALGKERRGPLHPLKLVIGTLDVFMTPLLKPAAAELRAALIAAQRDKPLLPLPPAGTVILEPDSAEARMGAQVAGFRAIGKQMLRIDMVERLARHAHDARIKAQAIAAGVAGPADPPVADAPPPAAGAVEDRASRPPETAPAAKRGKPAAKAFAVPDDLATSLGLASESYAQLMRQMGFRRAATETATETAAETVPETGTETAAEAGTETGTAHAEPAAAPGPTPAPGDAAGPDDMAAAERAVPADAAGPAMWTWRGLVRKPAPARPPRRKPAVAAPPDQRQPPGQRPVRKDARPRRQDDRAAPRRAAQGSARATANPFADLKSLIDGAPQKDD